MHEIPELDRKGLRDFGLVTGVIIAALFGIFFPWVFEAKIPTWPWILGGGLAAWGLAAPDTLKPVYTNWMKFGLLLSRITTPIVLGIVFYLVIFPIGFAMRLFGRDSLARRIDTAATSYRIPSVKAPRENMERPF